MIFEIERLWKVVGELFDPLFAHSRVLFKYDPEPS